MAVAAVLVEVPPPKVSFGLIAISVSVFLGSGTHQMCQLQTVVVVPLPLSDFAAITALLQAIWFTKK